MKKQTISSPLSGKVIPLSDVSDPMFRDEILGKGCAVIPSTGVLTSPADGVIDSIPESRHAVMMTTAEGTELLIHIGIDTVELRGEHFRSLVSAGDRVRAGDVLIEFDVDEIAKAGYDTTTPIVITNSDVYTGIKVLSREVNALSPLIELAK